MSFEKNKSFDIENTNLVKYFQNENPLSFFHKEISLKGSLYLEDLKFSSKILEGLLRKAVDMNFIIHNSNQGTLILDPNFLGG